MIDRFPGFVCGATRNGAMAGLMLIPLFRFNFSSLLNISRRRERLHIQLLRAIAIPALVAICNAPLFSQTAPGWTPLGPIASPSDASGTGLQDYGVVAGRVTSVAIDPADKSGNTVYIGAANGGVWKSVNAGSASPNPVNIVWKPLTDNQPTLAIGTIAIQPGNSNPSTSVVLAGTGEANSSGDSYYGRGILRSQDGGNTWTLITQATTGQSFAGLGFSRIAFSSTNNQIVVAATTATAHGITSGLLDPSAQNRGLYYSTDAGQTWNFAVLNDGSVAAVPESATSVAYDATANRFFAAVRFHGFYSSADGANWTRLESQPGGALLASSVCPATPASNACPIYRGELAVVPGRNEIYAWYVDAANTDMHIWQSKDAGASWQPIHDSGITNCGDPFAGCGTANALYGMELAAVPNGATATDLYAGAVNIYKCQINSVVPDCSSTGANQFVNLTHAYGCSPLASTAHVHPNQHGVDFLVVGAKDVMYFANDGGVYRALDGFTGLNTGTCGSANQFDDLNQTLGSLAQVVSFAQSTPDMNTILTGTKSNGSLANGSAESGPTWSPVNGSDGGYTAIFSGSPPEWFTENSGVSIQRCTKASACRSSDFSMVVTASKLGGDQAGVFTPYVLDPQAKTSELIVGTCRVWRGAGTGTGFTALSSSFETGSGGCTGAEINKVRALAVGGPRDSNGFSNVIYAGTDGLGPNAGSASQKSGRVWVTTNAAGGPSSWVERTDATNPNNFPISSIALDSSDGTGHTAYTAIMGFHVSRVWKTTSAGVSWTDFSGSGASALPDAPVDALALDPQTSTLYAGTDAGVFSSPTSNPAWTQVGPASSSGIAGFLPDVPVTALQIFTGSGIKRLRASTYGRGIWEFPLPTGPDFQIAMPVVSQDIFPRQTAAFNGTVSAFNGYNADVTLTCTAGSTSPPAVCSFAPATPFVPSSSGTPFMLTATGAIGDYFFEAHGSGDDPNTTTHSLAAAVHVIDFAIGAPSPGSVTVPRGTASSPVAFQVSGLGSFSLPVNLSCTGLPAGATCTFNPSATVDPGSSAPLDANVTIAVPASAAVGASTVSIVANVDGAPAAKSQNLALTVTLNPDFLLSQAAPLPAIRMGAQASATINITAQDGFADNVALTCSSACSVSPSSVSLNTTTTTAATVTVDATNLTPGNYSLTLTGASSGKSHVLTIPFTVVAANDFAITVTPPSQTIVAGTLAQYTISISPAGFAGPVAFSNVCSGLPNLSTCSITPPTVTPSLATQGSSGATAVLTITTTASVAASIPTRRLHLFALVLIAPFGMIFVADARRRKRTRRFSPWFLMGVLVLLVLVMSSCGSGLSGNGTAPASTGTGGGQPGTSAGTYSITVTATSGTLSHSAVVKLTVQ